MSFRTLSLADFAAQVQARTPTPGGGTVSAIAASFAASLGVMAARFTLGREEALKAGGEIERRLAELAAAADAFLTLADDDAKAYEGFGAAQKLPKATPEEKQARKTAMQSALRVAAEVPLAGMQRCVDLLAALAAVRPHCNPHLTSDLGVGAWLTWAALHGCRLNVEVNLTSLQDEAFVTTARAEVVRLAARAAELHRQLTDPTAV